MDIFQNSIKANATNIYTNITAYSDNDLLTIEINDNGDGMTKDFIEIVTSPFVTTRTTRKIGLGISLFKESAEKADGKLEITSQLGIGTTVKATFVISHIDRLPLGDINETILSVIVANHYINLKLQLKCDKREFFFDTEKIKETLGGIPLNDLEIADWISDYLKENINNTFGGVLNEIFSWIGSFEK